MEQSFDIALDIALGKGPVTAMCSRTSKELYGGQSFLWGSMRQWLQMFLVQPPVDSSGNLLSRVGLTVSLHVPRYGVFICR